MAWNNDGPVVLADLYPTIPPGLLDDYQKIQTFFQDQGAVKTAMKALTADAMDFEPEVTNAETFAAFLTATENTLHFTGVEKVNKLLIQKDFFAILKKGKTMDDQGAPEAHGHWTHRVQWILVGKYMPLILTNSVIDLYKGIAGIKQPLKAPAFPGASIDPYAFVQPTRPWTLWDALFDRGDNTDEPYPNNAARPEYFHAVWLYEDEQDDISFLRYKWE